MNGTITQEAAREALLRRHPELTDEEALTRECWRYYSFPKVFGSTAGPFGGYGGQMFTTFQIEVWEYDTRYVVIGCEGRVVKVAEGAVLCAIEDRDGKPLRM